MIYKIIVYMMGILVSIPGFALKPSISPKGGKMAVRVSAALSEPLQRALSCHMRDLAFRPKITPLQELEFEMYEPSKEQLQDAYELYKEALEATEEFAKNMDIRVYYQCTEEPRPFSINEIEDIYKELLQVRAQLNEASLYLKPGDEGFWNATSYLTNVEQYLTTVGTGVIPSLLWVGENYTPEERTDRMLNYLEFSLGTTLPPLEECPEPNLFAHQEEWAAKLPLPKQLKVAVVMDSVASIFWLRWMKSQVEGMKDWQVDFYADPVKFLDTPDHLKYDLVLTDILINNGGGVYLTLQLRRQKFEGAVLAATNYAPKNTNMRAWFRAGLDGMISLDGLRAEKEMAAVYAENDFNLKPEELGDLQEIFQKIEAKGKEPFYKQFLQALRNYYYYRDKHHWKR